MTSHRPPPLDSAAVLVWSLVRFALVTGDIAPVRCRQGDFRTLGAARLMPIVTMCCNGEYSVSRCDHCLSVHGFCLCLPLSRGAVRWSASVLPGLGSALLQMSVQSVSSREHHKRHQNFQFVYRVKVSHHPVLDLHLQCQGAPIFARFLSFPSPSRPSTSF